VTTALPSYLETGLDMLRARLPVPAGAAILAVGSAVEGPAQTGSDVDFLVLLSGRDGPPAPAAGVASRRTTIGVDYVVETPVGTLNPEFVPEETCERLSPLADAIASALERGRPDNLPYLQPREARLVDRLRTGRVLSGGDGVARWSRRLKPDLILPYWATGHLLGAEHVLTSALRNLERGDRDTALLRARMGAESLVLPALACHGIVAFDLKHAAAHVRKLERSDRPLPTVLARLLELQLPRPSIDAGAYLERLAGAALELLELVEREDATAPAARLLHSDGFDRKLRTLAASAGGRATSKKEAL
jgi:hypothetical protein